jgi:hypothetical protein
MSNKSRVAASAAIEAHTESLLIEGDIGMQVWHLLVSLFDFARAEGIDIENLIAETRKHSTELAHDGRNPAALDGDNSDDGEDGPFVAGTSYYVNVVTEQDPNGEPESIGEESIDTIEKAREFAKEYMSAHSDVSRAEISEITRYEDGTASTSERPIDYVTRDEIAA